MNYDAYTDFRRYLEDFVYMQKKVDLIIKFWKERVFPELAELKTFSFVEDNDYTVVVQCYREQYLIDFSFEYLLDKEGERTDTNIVSKIMFYKSSKNILDDSTLRTQIGEVVYYDDNKQIFNEDRTALFPNNDSPAFSLIFTAFCDAVVSDKRKTE